MRTREQIASDEARLHRCAQIDAVIEKIADEHPGMSLRELASKLPADEATGAADADR